MVADLNSWLKTTVIGMKLLRRWRMAAIPKIRQPSSIRTTDQISMASRRLDRQYRRRSRRYAVSRGDRACATDEFLAGAIIGVWHGTAEDARKRRGARCGAVRPVQGARDPLTAAARSAGHLPGLCRPADDHLIDGPYTGYKFEWGVVGETCLHSSWGRALKTREPGLSAYTGRRWWRAR
jgi:hypothetical protein